MPVAPQVVARTRFSSPPPARTRSLSVPEAMELLGLAMAERKESISMVAITGPGDPLATPEITQNTIELVRARYPQLKIGLKTLGLGSERLAGQLARAGLDYLEMQVDGVRQEILEKIYAWIRPGPKTLKIAEAVVLLIKEQRNGVPALKFHNITVSIQTTLYPGYNIDHVARISSEMMELGADSIALIPYVSGPDVEVSMESPTPEEVETAVVKAGKHLPVVDPVLHRLPADGGPGESQLPKLPKPTRERPNIAVVSSNGMEIDLHLGQAIRFMIYGPREDGLACLLATRDAPEPGAGAGRWQQVAATLNDCFLLLAASAGETPRRVLAESGLKLLLTEENIEGMVDVLYGGGKKGKKNKNV